MRLAQDDLFFAAIFAAARGLMVIESVSRTAAVAKPNKTESPTFLSMAQTQEKNLVEQPLAPIQIYRRCGSAISPKQNDSSASIA
jgi:hypothetical protein